MPMNGAFFILNSKEHVSEPCLSAKYKGVLSGLKFYNELFQLSSEYMQGQINACSAVGPYIVLRRFLRRLAKPEEFQIGQVKIDEEMSVSQTC